MGIRTMTLPRMTLSTASTGDTPRATREEARASAGMETDRPSQKSAMSLARQVRSLTLVGARSAL